MKLLLTVLLIFIMVFSLTDVFSQVSRRNQIELYGGIGIPLSPDEFKDYYKLGLSLNAQYVFFPSPKIGIPIFAGYERFTVDNDAINELFQEELGVGEPLYDEFGNYIGEFSDASLDVSGNANTIKFGAGVRPYLTNPESSTQFFLFANGSFNLVNQGQSLDGGNVEFTDASGNVYDLDLEEYGFTGETELKLNKFGIGIGAGLEIPAGSSINLIFQGMYNIIFTKGDAEMKFDGESEDIEIEDNLSFIGITAGVVF